MCLSCLVQSSVSTALKWAASTTVSPHPADPLASVTAASSCRQTARHAKVCERIFGAGVVVEGGWLPSGLRQEDVWMWCGCEP